MAGARGTMRRPGERAAGRALPALLLAVLLAGTLAALATHGSRWRWPDRHDPWAPLKLTESPGWLTRHKLRRLDERPAACIAVLTTSALRFDVLPDPDPDREAAPGCTLRNAVRVRAAPWQVGEGLTLSCRAAVSLALWERHAVRPAAQGLLGAPVRRLDHFGSYACRNVDGRATGPRSQHASADALDVAGFVLQDGRRISVARDWQGDAAPARFLRHIHTEACRYFDATLGPDYNRQHADHFHLDRGPYRACR